jgi:hypothetical protein
MSFASLILAKRTVSPWPSCVLPIIWICLMPSPPGEPFTMLASCTSTWARMHLFWSMLFHYAAALFVLNFGSQITHVDSGDSLRERFWCPSSFRLVWYDRLLWSSCKMLFWLRFSCWLRDAYSEGSFLPAFSPSFILKNSSYDSVF